MSQALVIVFGVLVVVVLFVGLVWLFVRLSRNNPNTLPPAADSSSRTQSASAAKPPTSASAPGMNRAARRRKG